MVQIYGIDLASEKFDVNFIEKNGNETVINLFKKEKMLIFADNAKRDIKRDVMSVYWRKY